MPYTYKYPKADVTVDIVLFTILDNALQVLLIQRRDPPFKGCWAFPGGFVNVTGGRTKQGETLEKAALRELREETGLKGNIYLEQLYTFGRPGRDPRGRVISVAYYALISAHLGANIKAGDDASDARWWDVNSLDEKLAFDHDVILETAVLRIRGKIDYFPQIAFRLLPSVFTAAEFQQVHEAVKGVTFDSSNFRKRFRRMVADGVLVGLGLKKKTAGAPAQLYSLTHHDTHDETY